MPYRSGSSENQDPRVRRNRSRVRADFQHTGQHDLGLTLPWVNPLHCLQVAPVVNPSLMGWTWLSFRAAISGGFVLWGQHLVTGLGCNSLYAKSLVRGEHSVWTQVGPLTQEYTREHRTPAQDTPLPDQIIPSPVPVMLWQLSMWQPHNVSPAKHVQVFLMTII